MNALPKFDIMEATRLTREGRLHDAMAILQGKLSESVPPSIDSGRRQPQTHRTPTVLDMVPPSTANGISWTAPKSADVHSAAVSERKVPEALRGILGHMGKFGSGGGLEGLLGRSAVHTAAPLTEGAKFEERTFANDAGSRAYKLYVPSGYEGQSVPLVVMLHGCTQSPDDFAAGTRMNEIAEEQTFLVAYPAQPQSANVSKCWNWFSAGDQQRDRGEPSLIAGITRQVMGDFTVSSERIYIAGLSAGGAAAAIMGSTYPDLYAAIGVHSGLACGAAKDMPSAFTAMRQGGDPARAGSGGQGGATVPTIVFHGDRDTTVSPVNGDQVIAQSKAAADLRGTVTRGQTPDGVGYTCTVQATEAGRSMLEQWVLHGVGHAWSGGSATGSYTEPRGPDASREMVRFFLEHPKAGAQ